MSYNNDTKIAQPSGSNNVNDPTYPGPSGRMFVFKKNITLHLATTRLPKSVYDHVDFASDVFDLPPSNKSIEAMVIATPKKKKDPKIEGQYFVRTRSGKEVKKLLFTKQGELLLDATPGTVATRPAPSRVSSTVRKTLEKHCYINTMKFVDLAKYGYILTNNKVAFGDFHALMSALYGKAASDPDAYMKWLKTEAKKLKLLSQSGWPVFWAGYQDFITEMQAAEDEGVLKQEMPLTEYEQYTFVLEQVRTVFPRINTLYLNAKGTVNELTLPRVLQLIQAQELDCGLSAKRVHDDAEATVNFTGFSGHKYDGEGDFDGNKSSFGDGNRGKAPWHDSKYSKTGRGKGGRGRGKGGRGRGKGKGGRGEGKGGATPYKKHHCNICEKLEKPVGVIKTHDQDACVEKGGGCDGKSISQARQHQRQLDRKYFVGKVKAQQRDEESADVDQGEVDDQAFNATVQKVMAARLQGEVNCAGLQVFLGTVYDEPTQVEVNRAEAFTFQEGYKQIDNGLSYFHLMSDQKWFPLGGTTNHKVTLKVAKESVQPVKAAMLGPAFFKVGPDEHGAYSFFGGDEHVGICDARFAELVCYNRFERTVTDVKTGDRFVTADDKLVINYGKANESSVRLKYERDAHFLPVQPMSMDEVREHFPDDFHRYSAELGVVKVQEEDAYPQEVAHMVENADAHGVITREQFLLTTHANPRQLDEIIREGSVQGIEDAKKRTAARKEDPLKMAPDDDCNSRMQGRMRPPQEKSRRHSESPYEYGKGEHLSMDPVGPVKVPSPGGFDCAMVYADKSTDNMSVQLFRSLVSGGTRKVKSLLAEEVTLREHDDIKYTGVGLTLRFITSDSEARMMTDEVEDYCADKQVTHLKSPPRSHRYNFVEGRMKTLVSKALSAFHYAGYPLMFFLHSFVHAAAAINMLTTKTRSDEADRFKSPHERRYGKVPSATDLYPHGAKVYIYPTAEERNKHSGRGRIAYYLHPHRLTPLSHDLWDPNAMEIVQRADELFNVIYKVTYGMEMGEQFEKRLKMQRNARKLDEDSSRQMVSLCNDQDLLGKFVQASMHKKLAMEQQIGHKLTSRDSGYQRLLDKAIDEQVEKEAKRLEQLAASEKPSDVLQGAADDGDAGASVQPRTSNRVRKQTDRPGQIWLESWNNSVKTVESPPTADLFMEAVETMMLKTEEQCLDLIDRIGNEFDIEAQLFLMQAEHWHGRAKDDYTTVKEAASRHAGEGEAVIEAYFDEVDFMYGKVDGKARVICRDYRDLLKEGRLKRYEDIMRAPKPIIKKKLIPDPERKGKKKFQRMRVRLTSPGHLMRAYLHYDPNKTAAPVMHQSTFVLICILAVLYDLDMFSTDDSKAFYFGETDFEYFTFLPEIIRDMPEYAPFGKYTVWEPVSSWYGTKSAALEYFNATKEHVCDPQGMAMMQSSRDPAFFIRWFDRKDVLFFGTHVDDKIGATSQGERLYNKWFLPEMNKKFILNGEPLNDFNFTVGVDFHYDKPNGTIYLSHESSINQFMEDNDLQGLAPKEFPCTPELYKKVMATPQPSTDEEKEENKPIRSAYLKYLGWAAHISRTTVPWAITACVVAAQFMANPAKIHFALVIQIIAHLKWVVREKMWRRISRPKGWSMKDGKIWVTCMFDSDHRGNTAGSSNSGMACFMCGIYLHGFRKKQKCITLNTCESEFMSMSHAGQFLIWLMLFLIELDFPMDFPAALLGDNTASISVAYSPSSTRYARHIDLRAKFVARMLKMRDYVLAYIRTHSNIADQFTKIVDPISHRRFRKWLANGLDDEWDGEVVETLENLFQLCKMREMAETKKEQRKQLQSGSSKKRCAETKPTNADGTKKARL
jgi:hypothetical protein